MSSKRRKPRTPAQAVHYARLQIRRINEWTEGLTPAGPWREPQRFRDFLAHDYDDQAIPTLMWKTITTDLADLDDALGRIEVAVGGPYDPDA